MVGQSDTIRMAFYRERSHVNLPYIFEGTFSGLTISCSRHFRPSFLLYKRPLPFYKRHPVDINYYP